MSMPHLLHTDAITAEHDDDSDYGDFSEGDQEIINQLLEKLAAASGPPKELLNHAPRSNDGGDEGVDDAGLDVDNEEPSQLLALPRILGKEIYVPQESSTSRQTGTQMPIYSPSTTVRSGARSIDPESKPIDSPEISSTTAASDSASPLQRFRTKPKKALSVTDLVTPAWCELQYLYSLSKYGRVRATMAMRRGTTVHKTLEDQVHVSVPVAISTKEDKWGLRIWNVISGLRTLQETGRTRELMVWGVIEGEIISGVIDELSYECPDATVVESGVTPGADIEDLPDLAAASTVPKSKGVIASNQGVDNRMVYISDTKTRILPSLPTDIASRPTKVQLQLYHKLLTALAHGTLPLSIFASRYNFDPHATFSDSFIAQVGNLNEQLSGPPSSPPSNNQPSDKPPSPSSSSQTSLDILTQHNTPSSLWSLMLSRFRHTFLLPLSPTTTTTTTTIPTRISPHLTASYIHSSSRSHLGHKHFFASASELSSHVDDTMAWWRGDRRARGVPVQEFALKCRNCAFLDACEWVQERRDEGEEVRRRRLEANGAGNRVG